MGPPLTEVAGRCRVHERGERGAKMANTTARCASAGSLNDATREWDLTSFARIWIASACLMETRAVNLDGQRATSHPCWGCHWRYRALKGTLIHAGDDCDASSCEEHGPIDRVRRLVDLEPARASSVSQPCGDSAGRFRVASARLKLNLEGRLVHHRRYVPGSAVGVDVDE